MSLNSLIKILKCYLLLTNNIKEPTINRKNQKIVQNLDQNRNLVLTEVVKTRQKKMIQKECLK